MQTFNATNLNTASNVRIFEFQPLCFDSFGSVSIRYVAATRSGFFQGTFSAKPEMQC